MAAVLPVRGRRSHKQVTALVGMGSLLNSPIPGMQGLARAPAAPNLLGHVNLLSFKGEWDGNVPTVMESFKVESWNTTCLPPRPQKDSF